MKKMDVKAIFCSTIHEENFEKASNIFLQPYLPSHKVMTLCDLAIIHGGQGSVQTAIASGVPIIGFPLQAEQNFNLGLVEKHGAGMNLPLKIIKKGNLMPVIKKVLNDNSFKTNMQGLKKYQDKYNGSENTAGVLQELKKKPPL